MTTVIKSGMLVSGSNVYEADILIDGEQIQKIGKDLHGDQTIDASGCYVFPGFIDGHTHMDMPLGNTVTADDFASGTTAALAGGTTMIIDFAGAGESPNDALKIWHSRADGNCACDYGFHMTLTNMDDKTRTQLQNMKEEGITSFKCYYAYSMMVDDQQMYDVLCEMKEIGGILGVHCENGPVIDSLRQKALAMGHTDPSWHGKTRPPITEGEAVGRFLRIANLAGAPAWVVHLSTEDGMKEIRMARERGQKVYVESCPHYFILDESVYEKPDFESAKFVCAPPLRGKHDQECMWKTLQNGEINIVSTDHCSFNFKGQKEIGRDDFTKIPGGLPGVEHRGVLMYTTGVTSGRISVSTLCRVLSEEPSKMFGVYPQKGILAPGSDADIVIYDPSANEIISSENQHMRCDYTPYEGFQTAGSIRDVFLRGTHAVHNGKVLKNKLGKYVYRGNSTFF